MKSAIIGYGVIGQVHAKSLEEIGGEIVAVCDVDEQKLKDAPGQKHYTDYVEMFDKEQIDIVHICTPHFLHKEMVIEALSRDINVLCEKPLCISEEEIIQILQAEQKSKAQLGVCQQNRYNQVNLYAKEYLRGKKITGGVGFVAWKRNADYYNSAEWRGKIATEGGGVLINQALHTFDIMQWLTGMPDNIVANVSTIKLKDVIEVEDTATVVAENENGGFTFFATNANVFDCPVEIVVYTTEGWIKILSSDVLTEKEHKHFEQCNGYGKACYGSGHSVLIAEFYDCVRDKKHFPIDGAEGAKVVRMILAAYRSNGKKEKISK